MINAVYIHIPFCKEICHYCDFNKIYFNEQLVDDYLNSLEREIILTNEISPIKKTPLNSIFVGGGTPTALTPKQLTKLTEIIKSNLTYDKNTEYTFEANPDGISDGKLAILKSAGVNRLSFGVQSFNNDLLEKIGRTHRANDAISIINKAYEHDFKNISIDLMFGLPGQTVEQFYDSLEIAVSLPISHLSSYSLLVEPKTVFYNLLQKGKLNLPTVETEAEMYELLMSFLEKRGFKQYEISNFSKQSFESRHNLTYWNNDQYYGFGAGAHGYVNNNRQSNVYPVNKYIKYLNDSKLPIQQTTKVTEQHKVEEEMFLGLRKMAGVSKENFKSKFNYDVSHYYKEELESLLMKQLIEIDDSYIKLTHDGKLLGNEVFQTFLK